MAQASRGRGLGPPDVPPGPEPEVELDGWRRTYDTSEILVLPTWHPSSPHGMCMWGEQISEREISEPVCERVELACEADLLEGSGWGCRLGVGVGFGLGLP